MRSTTYHRLDNLYKKYNGYISTRELLHEGFSNCQIACLTEENYLERICHGHYWMMQCGLEKPKDYKCIEVCLGNPRAVIAMKSACFYQGLTETEPEVLAVATERTDRSKINMRFPVERHYFSGSNFHVGMKSVKTEFGSYHIYDVERSICDILRLGGGISPEVFLSEISPHLSQNEEQYERILKYTEMLRLNTSLSLFRR